MDKRYPVKKKIRMIYLSMSILVLVLFSVVMKHVLLQEKKSLQHSTESKLPYGNYLPDSENPMIRVVIKTNGFRHITHMEVKMTCDQGLIVTSDGNNSEYSKGEVLHILPDDVRFQNGSIQVESKNSHGKITVNSLERGYGVPSYQGKMELFCTAEGIVIVNELPLEEYLYAVVPSEMPSAYEMEALKCQAVCARSYAYCQMKAFGYPEYEAHVDDSTSYQVYGNSLEKETTTQAVRETAGQTLTYQEQTVKTYYYSTSCGKSTNLAAWGTPMTEENKYLSGVAICDEEGNDYEKTLPWYRWSLQIPAKQMSDLVELNTGKEIGTLKNIKITKTGQGGVVLQLELVGTKSSIFIDTENKIRQALGGSGCQVKKQDGSTTICSKLLPSAFFKISKNGEQYVIEGGGYGHGIGMSQNGANAMAKTGKDYETILQFFYPGAKVKMTC